MWRFVRFAPMTDKRPQDMTLHDYAELLLPAMNARVRYVKQIGTMPNMPGGPRPISAQQQMDMARNLLVAMVNKVAEATYCDAVDYLEYVVAVAGHLAAFRDKEWMMPGPQLVEETGSDPWNDGQERGDPFPGPHPVIDSAGDVPLPALPWKDGDVKEGA